MNRFLNNLKKKNLIYFVVSTLALLLIATLVPILKPPLLNTLKYPFTLLTSIKREVGGIIFYHRNLIQNKKLKKEIDLLRYNLNHLNEIYLENVRLTKMLSLKQTANYKVIASMVIGRSADNWSSAIIIDKGRDSDIKNGMVVINYLGLVGRIIETTKYTSKIMLINHPNFNVSAVAQRSRQEGLVSGRLGNSLLMRYLPLKCDIKISDAVVTSGLTPLYPKGLLIGSIIDIQEELSGLSRYAIIKPAVELSTIEEVLIIVQ